MICRETQIYTRVITYLLKEYTSTVLQFFIENLSSDDILKLKADAIKNRKVAHRPSKTRLRSETI